MEGMTGTVPMVSDDELTAEALSADPDQPVPDDATSIWEQTPALVGDWYMPAPMAGGHLLHGWRRRVALLLIATFLLIEAYGLCSTYGR
jgi:hypothetical protein